ncbi:MAG: 4Fe-4S binding protein, partial [Bacteroidales bacterium]|nr:4Fe-4S binding protein [Bacteroidales bacterium]
QRIIDDLTLGLQTYMAKNGISKISDMVGSDIGNFVSPLTVDRDTMVFPTIDREKCIGCGRCYISCKDGGHQAISFGDDRQPKINGAKCVGCHLCRLVCPTGAMGIAKRIPKREKQAEEDSA